jgi:hypothetical protein
MDVVECSRVNAIAIACFIHKCGWLFYLSNTTTTTTTTTTLLPPQPLRYIEKIHNVRHSLLLRSWAGFTLLVSPPPPPPLTLAQHSSS